MLSLFAKQRIIAHSGYNRLLLLHAYIAIHACIGTMVCLEQL